VSTLRDILRGVPQDAEFHPEGDVWTHTRAVRSAMQQAIAMAKPVVGDVTREQQKMLRAAAWLHDVGKAHATVKINGRWRSPAHERAVHVKAMLRKLGWPWRGMWEKATFEEKKTLAYLAARHMAMSDDRGIEARVIRAMRSGVLARQQRAELLLVLMMMDRLGCDRESRVEDARIVIRAVTRG
jgi:hypothetical protein